jgi:hypothetical protein
MTMVRTPDNARISQKALVTGRPVALSQGGGNPSGRVAGSYSAKTVTSYADAGSRRGCLLM